MCASSMRPRIKTILQTVISPIRPRHLPPLLTDGRAGASSRCEERRLLAQANLECDVRVDIFSQAKAISTSPPRKAESPTSPENKLGFGQYWLWRSASRVNVFPKPQAVCVQALGLHPFFNSKTKESLAIPGLAFCEKPTKSGAKLTSLGRES